MSDQPEKQHREEDEFFEGERLDDQPRNQPEFEPERLRKRREWLRSLSQEDRNIISKYGFDYWERLTGRKRDVI